MPLTTNAKKSTAKPRSPRAKALAPKALGRRPGLTNTRENILDAAEEVFAALGFAGASTREIAAKADVNQALLHHYFGTKEGLLREVFLRRGLELARRRIELLDELEQRTRAPRAEQIVGAYLLPAYDLKRSGGSGGQAFLQLQARLHNELQMITSDMRNAVYDEAMRRYITALSKALPLLDVQTVYWRMVFAVGAYLYTISDQHRLEMISGGTCDPKDLDTSFNQLTAFIVGGMKAKASA